MAFNLVTNYLLHNLQDNDIPIYTYIIVSYVIAVLCMVFNDAALNPHRVHDVAYLPS